MVWRSGIWGEQASRSVICEGISPLGTPASSRSSLSHVGCVRVLVRGARHGRAGEQGNRGDICVAEIWWKFIL